MSTTRASTAATPTLTLRSVVALHCRSAYRFSWLSIATSPVSSSPVQAGAGFGSVFREPTELDREFEGPLVCPRVASKASQRGERRVVSGNCEKLTPIGSCVQRRCTFLCPRIPLSPQHCGESIGTRSRGSPIGQKAFLRRRPTLGRTSNSGRQGTNWRANLRPTTPLGRQFSAEDERHSSDGWS
jgi:hypothetical protein